MFSITEAKKKLPEDFVNLLYQDFDVHTVDRILSGMLAERNTSFRVNTLLTDAFSIMRFMQEENIKIERQTWYPDAFLVKNKKEREIEALDCYQQGKIYLQSLSSQIPALVLDPKPYEKILDIAAAPGSKTTQMACLMKNHGFILANEKDPIRFEKLLFNLKKQNAQIVQAKLGKGEKIGQAMPEYFDKVLLDVPCSGEGLFCISKPSTYQHWSLETVRKYASLQKKLFQSGLEALKKGGILVYSTCTLNHFENEEIIQWALDSFSIKLLPITLEIKEKIKSRIPHTLKIIPSKNFEGFFVCKILKIN